MKDEFFHGLIVDQVLVDDSIEHGFVYAVVPNAIGIDDEQGSVVADAEAGCCAAFDAYRVVVFAELTEFVGQRAVDAGCFAVGITIAAGADKDVSGIGCLNGCILVQKKFSVEKFFCHKNREDTKISNAVFCVFLWQKSAVK